jgi:hypothetical protein
LHPVSSPCSKLCLAPWEPWTHGDPIHSPLAQDRAPGAQESPPEPWSIRLPRDAASEERRKALERYTLLPRLCDVEVALEWGDSSPEAGGCWSIGLHSSERTRYEAVTLVSIFEEPGAFSAERPEWTFIQAVDDTEVEARAQLCDIIKGTILMRAQEGLPFPHDRGRGP